MGDLQRRVIERNADIRDIFRIARDCNLLVISFLDEIKEQYEQTLNNYVREQIKLFVMGTKDVNSEWDNYVKQVEELGLKAVLNMKQTAYDRASK